MYLFLDTETTGLPRNYNAPITDLENWPRILKIAWLLCDNSEKILDSKDYIIKPRGFTIPKSAIRIHGISTEKALNDGINIRIALKKFLNSLQDANYLIAHNFNFDEKILSAEFLRENLEIPFKGIKKICVMRSSAEYCKIPGVNGYKWPSLTELYFKLFNSNFKEAHNAKTDLVACAKCYFELKKIGALI